ncbi:MAG: hypothetical protein HY843_00160 [Bdellovibrio sp.]|nr:hypothetical protein [Bdellovibrio sp.]
MNENKSKESTKYLKNNFQEYSQKERLDELKSTLDAIILFSESKERVELCIKAQKLRDCISDPESTQNSPSSYSALCQEILTELTHLDTSLFTEQHSS